MSNFGPSRSEILFRLWTSMVGLVLVMGAILFRGMPSGPAMFEVVGLAALFFGGTLAWSIVKLNNLDDEGEE